MIGFTYETVAELNAVSYDIVEGDVRYIRKAISKFAKGARFKVRELAYYQCFRAEVRRTRSRQRGLKVLKEVYNQDIAESSIY